MEQQKQLVKVPMKALLSTTLLSLGLLISLSTHAKQAIEEQVQVPLNDEVLTRQALIQVALARKPADMIIRGATVLNVFTGEWEADHDIVIHGERIAWVGKTGGKASRSLGLMHRDFGLFGFGESINTLRAAI